MAIDINHSLGKISTSGQDLILETSGQDTNVSVSSKRVINVQDPIDDQDAVTKKFLTTALALITGNANINLSQINNTLNKLTPQQPQDISNKTINLSGTGSYRITDFVQTDNTGNGLTAAAGDIVPVVLRNNDFVTNTLTQIGPGDSLAVEVIRNGITTARKVLSSESNNGTFTDLDSLSITNNVDYGTITGDPLGFWKVYDARAIGINTVNEGWNNIKLVQGDAETNTVTWYSDQSNPGAPQVSNIVVQPNLEDEKIVYSSNVPHYTNQQQFNVSFDVNKLSGDFYPSTDVFFDASATVPVNCGLNAISDLTYQQVGITTPLPRNYLVDSGTFNVATTVTVKTGTGISAENIGPSAAISNSYATTSVTLAPVNKIIYILDDVTIGAPIDETRVIVSNVGYGTGDAYRVETVIGDTPAEPTSYVAFNGASSNLNSFDATIVGGIAKHDTTDYSTGYYPVGPNLSISRSNSQYIQFEFKRTATSKFKISYTGKISGCWVRLPGSSLDATSTLNGWLDTSVPYEGIGVPGANTAAGGNGSNGCGLSSITLLNTTVTNRSTTVTFGTESSSNAENNSIIVRFKLNAGDSMSFLKFETAE
jgi:hypothetical protein